MIDSHFPEIDNALSEGKEVLHQMLAVGMSGWFKSKWSGVFRTNLYSEASMRSLVLVRIALTFFHGPGPRSVDQCRYCSGRARSS